MFKSLDEVKAVAEKFEAGKIIPARVIKCVDKRSKKISHKFKFGMDMYRLSGVKGNVFVCEFNQEGDSVIRIDLCKKTRKVRTFKGNPYGYGENFFIGNYGINNDEFLMSINQHVFGKTAVEV